MTTGLEWIPHSSLNFESTCLENATDYCLFPPYIPRIYPPQPLLARLYALSIYSSLQLIQLEAPIIAPLESPTRLKIIYLGLTYPNGEMIEAHLLPHAPLTSAYMYSAKESNPQQKHSDIS